MADKQVISKPAGQALLAAVESAESVARDFGFLVEPLAIFFFASHKIDFCAVLIDIESKNLARV